MTRDITEKLDNSWMYTSAFTLSPPCLTSLSRVEKALSREVERTALCSLTRDLNFLSFIHFIHSLTPLKSVALYE